MSASASGRTMAVVLIVWLAATIVTVVALAHSTGPSGSTYNGVCSRSAPQDC